MRFIKREGSIDEEKVKRSCSEFGLEPAFARLLVSRGIADIRAFLHPKKDDLHDPFLFKNMQISCERIRKAIKNQEKIAVYADYDADGICSASILCSALRENGALVSPYIPDRKTEGYGTNPDAIRKICEKGFSLIISVDCGIRSVDDVALAKSFGTDFIILDHHETGELPDTPYIIDPKAEDESYPCRELCGAGVVFKTVSALFGEKMMKYIDLAGIATIGDIVSLTGENRVIASLGIEKLKYDPNPGIAALCRAAGIEMEKIASRQVSFGIVPRLNAAGRLSHAKFALELILTNDRDKREKLALWLTNLNAERQAKQTDIFTEAAAQVIREQNLLIPNVIVAVKEGWEPGLVGLAASKVAEQFGRPTVVFTEVDGKLTGSARSACGVNLYEILNEAAHLYIKFGGHSQAAGLTLEKEKLPEARRIWQKKLNELYTDADFEKTIVYDEELTYKDLTFAFEKQLSLLEPMGQDNPEPLFLLKNTELTGIVPLSGGKHYKASLVADPDIEVIRFGAEEPFTEGEKTDLLGSFSINVYRDKRTRQFTVSHAAKRSIAKSEEFAYLPHIVAELSAYAKADHAQELEEEQFFGELLQSLEQSPLGTLVVIGTQEGETAFLKHSREIMARRFPPTASFREGSADNAFLRGWKKNIDLKNYRDIYFIGSWQADVPQAKRLKIDMKKTAESVFLAPDEMKKLLPAIKKAASERLGYRSLRDFAAHIGRYAGGYTTEQIWFAVNVLFGLNLIEIKKSEKYFIKYGGKSGNCVEINNMDEFLQESESYRSIRSIVKGEKS
ncbi:MAG: single-stranded-DNA-specific exonuclease RecJ [Clostridiales bacterium]|nr:single-stranded-DNA-specific exonuclease RecJ [Clostridiales bacterium]